MVYIGVAWGALRHNTGSLTPILKIVIFVWGKPSTTGSFKISPKNSNVQQSSVKTKKKKEKKRKGDLWWGWG